MTFLSSVASQENKNHSHRLFSRAIGERESRVLLGEIRRENDVLLAG